MKNTFLSIILFIASTIIFAQEDTVVQVNISNELKYEFTTVIDIEATTIKNQGKTGTCWSFSASSFI